MRVPEDTPNPVFAAYDEWAATQAKQADETRDKARAAAKESHRNHLLVLAGVCIAGLLVLAGLLAVVLFIVSQRTRKGMSTDGGGWPGHSDPWPPQQGRPLPHQNMPPGPLGDQPAPYPQPPAGPFRWIALQRQANMDYMAHRRGSR
jgi:hypothetical protein